MGMRYAESESKGPDDNREMWLHCCCNLNGGVCKRIRSVQLHSIISVGVPCAQCGLHDALSTTKKKKQKNHKGSCGVVHHRCTKLWNSIQVTFLLLFDTFDTHKLCTICVHEICRCVLFALLLSNKCGQHVLHICFPDGLKKKTLPF